jgi:uncharacterized surface protein with fasciclin (FAS1) repeats
MKKLTKIIGIAFLSLTIFSCSSDDSSSDNTVTGLASKRSDLTLLVQALNKAGLASTLQGAGPFTVFAPNNAAFIAAGYTSAAISALPANDPGLTQILLNHVVSGAVQSTGLVNNTYIKTLGKGTASATNTLSMYVNTASGVRLNGVSSVITTGGNFNIVASNGVIHVVDAVIGLPTVKTHATANPNFSTLASLLTAQGLVSTLDGTASSPFTVFGPVNTAFDAATLTLYGGITTAQKTDVLKYHVVTGVNVLSNAIPAGPITTFQGQTFTITGTSINDAGSDVNKNIILTDVQCSNGIVHAIDKVLLPNL